MKIKLSPHDHDVAFQDLDLDFLKHPYLQRRSMKMETRGDPLKGGGKAGGRADPLEVKGGEERLERGALGHFGSQFPL